MAISDRLNKLTTDITNAYTSIENKGGTIPANKNTDNLHTAIDSIEVIESATAEGESLSLTNTKAMPYSDYVVEGKSEQDGEPSPSNPSEIHSVADDVNLLNEETLTHGQLLSNNVINSSQTKMGYSDFINVSNFTNITISLKNSNLGYALERIFYYDSSKNEISNESPGNPKTFTPPNNTVYVRISITTTNWSSSVTFDEVKDDLHIKLQKGTVATPYSPYNQGTVTIKQRGTTENNDYTIQTEPLRSLPNGVKDTIEEDGIHRRVGKIVLNGTETWEEAGTQYTGLYSVFIYIDDMKKQEGYNGDLLSNYFKENDFSTQEEGITKSSNPTSFALILIRLSNDNATNMTTFKNWLSNNPTELLYELATEVIEPLTQNQATTMLDIIKTGSYEGTTNIYTDEDVKPTIGVDYYKKG